MNSIIHRRKTVTQSNTMRTKLLTSAQGQIDIKIYPPALLKYSQNPFENGRSNSEFIHCWFLAFLRHFVWSIPTNFCRYVVTLASNGYCSPLNVLLMLQRSSHMRWLPMLVVKQTNVSAGRKTEMMSKILIDSHQNETSGMVYQNWCSFPFILNYDVAKGCLPT
jgi:hypothetical protein